MCRVLQSTHVAHAYDACFGDAPSPAAERVPMSELVAGDHVLDSATTTSRVTINQHTAGRVTSKLVTLYFTGGSLSLTPDHMLFSDGALVPARSVASGVMLSGGRVVSRVVTSFGVVVNPITFSGTILAASRGAPVLAATHPEWIAEWMQRSVVPLPFSIANALSYLFPSATQTFYDAHAEERLAIALPTIKPLATLASPFLTATFFAADLIYAVAFAIYSLGAPVAILAMCGTAWLHGDRHLKGGTARALCDQRPAKKKG